jgi:hypothetical protein
MLRLGIFDFDETLAVNQPKYDAAKEAVASYVLDTMNPDMYEGSDAIIDDVLDADYTATWVGEEADNPLPAGGPWFRQDGLDTFAGTTYPVMAAFDETGAVSVLQEHR